MCWGLTAHSAAARCYLSLHPHAEYQCEPTSKLSEQAQNPALSPTFVEERPFVAATPGASGSHARGKERVEGLR